jgi:hypothetical protein
VALREGGRGLPGGSSLGKLLARRLGARTQAGICRLTVRRILRWADQHHARTGQWPCCKPHPIEAAPGENWKAIDTALRLGLRGLPGGSSLPRLLARRRGARNRGALPAFRLDDIRRWAQAHQARTGRWPTADTGKVLEAPDETWKGVEMALYKGHRGLPGRLTLARLRQDAVAGTTRRR